MKIVADTNVLVSPLIFPGGAPEAVYRLALEGRIELASSRPLLAEVGRVLTEKFGWEGDRAEAAVAQLVRVADVVEPAEIVDEVHEDPDDNRVLEAAAEANADAIVSGDRHLLRMGSWRDIPIEPPARFIAGLERS